jgi:hypothetical protein
MFPFTIKVNVWPVCRTDALKILKRRYGEEHGLFLFFIFLQLALFDTTLSIVLQS